MATQNMLLRVSICSARQQATQSRTPALFEGRHLKISARVRGQPSPSQAPSDQAALQLPACSAGRHSGWVHDRSRGQGLHRVQGTHQPPWQPSEGPLTRHRAALGHGRAPAGLGCQAAPAGSSTTSPGCHRASKAPQVCGRHDRRAATEREREGPQEGEQACWAAQRQCQLNASASQSGLLIPVFQLRINLSAMSRAKSVASLCSRLRAAAAAHPTLPGSLAAGAVVRPAGRHTPRAASQAVQGLGGAASGALASRDCRPYAAHAAGPVRRFRAGAGPTGGDCRCRGGGCQRHYDAGETCCWEASLTP